VTRIEVEGISKRYADPDGRVISASGIADVSFHAESGEFFTLLGPSGCGKSTTLRCVAGLEEPDAGTIRIGGRVVAGGSIFVPAGERDVGMVFQSYAVWPHMTVRDNVEFPLRYGHTRLPRAARGKQVAEALDLVQMREYADRDTPLLSGGQQQRVALARALASRPQVMLLDEPLSNLDARLRISMREELRRLTREVGITTLYVTHDQREALALSDRIAVLAEGQVLQVGAPVEIYRRPRSRRVAELVGEANYLEAVVKSGARAGEPVVVETPVGPLQAIAGADHDPGERLTLMLRPEAMRIARGKPAAADDVWNYLEVEVLRSVFVGEHSECLVQVEGELLAAWLQSYEELDAGEKVWLRFGVRWCWLLES
jgi:iron(III) transport system ATP-binding protein